MLNYKLIGTNDFDNPKRCVLQNRGIENVNEYLHLTSDCLIDYHNLDNISEAVQMFSRHIENKSKIAIVVDCDADGYTSASMMYLYIKRIAPEIHIECLMHEGKQHGLSPDITIPEETNFVILPDGGTNDTEQCKMLSEKGIDVLILDHHIQDKENSYAVIVNNQISKDYPNKELSGVGVTWQFCRYLDSLLNTSYADEYLDLVALGHVADMMDMRQKEINFLTYAGIGHIRNPLFSGLVNKQSFSLGEEITRTGLSFYVVPLINAVIRVGTQEEKEIVFKSMLEEDAYKLIPSTKRGCKGQLETNLEQALRICTNCHSRQKKLRVESADTLISKIENEKLNDNKIIIVEADDSIHKNLIGLVAMELVSRYKKPVLLVRAKELDNEQVLQGSGRNYDRGDLKDLKGFLEESKMFKYAEGHSSAFGACLPTANLNSFIDYANTNLANISFDPSYEVDILYKGNDVSYSDIMNLGSMKWLWGKGIEEPLIAIENLVVTPKNIQLLSPDKKPTLKITLPNGITVMKFRSSQEEYEKLVPNKDGYTTINLVGSCHINNFKGNKTPQIFIEDYEILNTIDYLF